MNVPDTIEGLTELFRKLGAPHPDTWASSQLREGIPQLQRFLWLREAWKCIIPDDNYEWMELEIKRAEANPGAPYSGVGLALKHCLGRGVEKEALKEIVRGKQAQLLFALCYMLDDPTFSEEEVKDLTWGIFQTDQKGGPLAAICGLHESVLETDPTGREMRPKKGT
ncbi:MAG: hypothetical protein C5B54_02895 [Acidobacteria bacterium]|nr:MAG: hypothetical protein C5B54_02895 [Acidobacteriota bacterium]